MYLSSLLLSLATTIYQFYVPQAEAASLRSDVKP